jgi:hypothetical protein
MSKSDISSADARNLVMDEPLLLDAAGKYPEFSPDGEEVLFAKSENEMSCLWRVNRNGGDKRKLVCPAIYGIWSPDGNKIAVTFGNLSLFDLKTQQSVVLPTTIGSCGQACGSYYSRDGKRIFILSTSVFAEGNPPGFQGFVLDLNDLAFTEFAYRDANQWLRQSNTSAVLHPKVDFRPGYGAQPEQLPFSTYTGHHLLQTSAQVATLPPERMGCAYAYPVVSANH